MKRVAEWLRRLADWLDPVPVALPEPAPPRSAFELRVAELVAEAQQTKGSGEFKRHQVYARLLKEFPDEPHACVGFAIEDVITRRRG